MKHVLAQKDRGVEEVEVAAIVSSLRYNDSLHYLTYC